LILKLPQASRYLLLPERWRVFSRILPVRTSLSRSRYIQGIVKRALKIEVPTSSSVAYAIGSILRCEALKVEVKFKLSRKTPPFACLCGQVMAQNRRISFMPKQPTTEIKTMSRSEVAIAVLGGAGRMDPGLQTLIATITA